MAAPMLSMLSACAVVAKAPAALVPPPCPRTVLAPHAFAATETETQGQQSVVGVVADASSKVRLLDTVVKVQCASSRGDLDVVVTSGDGRFRVLVDTQDGLDCDKLTIRFERDSFYALEEMASLHPDTTIEIEAQLVHVEAACLPMEVPVLGARDDVPREIR